MLIYQIFITAGIPSALTAFCFWLLKGYLQKTEEKRQAREALWVKNQTLIIKGLGAAFALGEVSARAICEGRHNGELTRALEYSKQIKQEQKDFYTELGIKNLYYKEA